MKNRPQAFTVGPHANALNITHAGAFEVQKIEETESKTVFHVWLINSGAIIVAKANVFSARQIVGSVTYEDAPEAIVNVGSARNAYCTVAVEVRNQNGEKIPLSQFSGPEYKFNVSLDKRYLEFVNNPNSDYLEFRRIKSGATYIDFEIMEVVDDKTTPFFAVTEIFVDECQSSRRNQVEVANTTVKNKERNNNNNNSVPSRDDTSTPTIHETNSAADLAGYVCAVNLGSNPQKGLVAGAKDATFPCNGIQIDVKYFDVDLQKNGKLKIDYKTFVMLPPIGKPYYCEIAAYVWDAQTGEFSGFNTENGLVAGSLFVSDRISLSGTRTKGKTFKMKGKTKTEKGNFNKAPEMVLGCKYGYAN
ncbi:MAG: hypothetical protein JNM93_01605 [Bacteriovoracaceae bacterium]|nr:hypothetical protein [Bacteriovoracaceae bacterium]